MPCELCGAESELFRTVVEGAEMNACKKCSSYGKVLGKAKIEVPVAEAKQAREQPKKASHEIVEAVMDDFAKKIRSRREKLGMNQEDFAKMITEKLSVLHKMESGSFVPSIATAMKLEKLLSLKLVEEQEMSVVAGEEKKSESSMTLGDIIKVRKR